MDWKKAADELYNELQRQKRKIEIYRTAIESIGTLGHIDINGQYEKAFNECLEIASKTYIDSGDYDEDLLNEDL